MKLNRHTELDGKHAMFGGSNSSWIRYSDEKLLSFLKNMHAKERGTKLHDYRCKAIELGRHQPDDGDTVNNYINDCIDYGMTPEAHVKFSEYFFGTRDAINFKDNVLRIFDLKTGTTPTHIEQLMFYRAVFCLEYDINPLNLEFDLRIYQSNDIRCESPSGSDIMTLMDRIDEINDIVMEYMYEVKYER